MNTNNFSDNQIPQLQFGSAEPIGPSAETRLACAACKQAINSSYYALGDQVLCTSCRDALSAPPQGSGLVRFAKAACLGTLAGLLGAAIWYLIRVVAHIEIGLVAILVGYLVGKAVSKASAGKGGLVYQLLAVFLTYGCISANYMPDIFQALMNQAQEESEASTAAGAVPAEAASNAVSSNESSTPNSETRIGETGTEIVDAPLNQPANASSPVAPLGEDAAQPLPMAARMVLVILIMLALALATPVLMGMESPIGLLIVGFALWEAWKFSAARKLPITGPYQVDSPASVD